VTFSQRKKNMNEETLKRIAAALETIAEEAKKMNTNLKEITKKLDWIDTSIGEEGIERILGDIDTTLNEIGKVVAR